MSSISTSAQRKFFTFILVFGYNSLIICDTYLDSVYILLICLLNIISKPKNKPQKTNNALLCVFQLRIYFLKQDTWLNSSRFYDIFAKHDLVKDNYFSSPSIVHSSIGSGLIIGTIYEQMADEKIWEKVEAILGLVNWS